MDKTLSKNCLQCGREMSKPPKYSLSQWEYKKYCNFICWGNHQEVALIGSVSPMKGKHHTKEANRKNSISHLKPNGITKIKGYYTHKALERYAKLKGSVGSFTLQEWEYIKKKYNYCCVFCGKQDGVIKLTKDHIIPITKGGSNFISNIQPLCQSCNSRKSNRLLIS
jgi:5-methylcytosine-specific restriction endonuclease McrA